MNIVYIGRNRRNTDGDRETDRDNSISKGTLVFLISQTLGDPRGGPQGSKDPEDLPAERQQIEGWEEGREGGEQ